MQFHSRSTLTLNTMFLHLSIAELLPSRPVAAGTAFRAEPMPKVMLNPMTNQMAERNAAVADALTQGAPPGVPMH